MSSSRRGGRGIAWASVSFGREVPAPMASRGRPVGRTPTSGALADNGRRGAHCGLCGVAGERMREHRRAGAKKSGRTHASGVKGHRRIWKRQQLDFSEGLLVHRRGADGKDGNLQLRIFELRRLRLRWSRRALSFRCLDVAVAQLCLRHDTLEVASGKLERNE